MSRFRLHTIILIIAVLLLSACALPGVEQKAEEPIATVEREVEKSVATVEREVEKPVATVEQKADKPVATVEQEAKAAPATPFEVAKATPQKEAGQREASTGVTSRQRQAVWPQDVYPVDVITEHPTGLTFTVREMRIEEKGLIIAWEATNRSDKALELKSEDGQPPLLQDNTGRIYEYAGWPEGEILSVDPGEKVAGEWRFGLPSFDAYRMRLGVNLLRAAVPIGVLGRQPSFWTDPWELPNPDWPQRELVASAEDVAEVQVDKLTVAIRSVQVEPTHAVIWLRASMDEGDIRDTATLAWLSSPELRGDRRYVLDEWSLEEWPQRIGIVTPGQAWEAGLIFYPAPQEGEELTLTLNPDPTLLEREPVVVIAFISP